MPRTKKKAKKAPARNRTPAKRKAVAKTSARSKSPRKARPASRDTEVERHWKSYLDNRTQLEAAVDAVRSAEEQVASARALERARRQEFDAAKNALEKLLEVAPASGGRPREASGLTAATPPGPRDERR